MVGYHVKQDYDSLTPATSWLGNSFKLCPNLTFYFRTSLHSKFLCDLSTVHFGKSVEFLCDCIYFDIYWEYKYF